ncbi:MAG: TolC family protein [Cytophagaceae bacterium]|jgi:NodT family efflux transporter outer membrane factor (OMF) lipoprotein|nr:TolC family protein [Cytophagaceae bacterium]
MRSGYFFTFGLVVSLLFHACKLNTGHQQEEWKVQLPERFNESDSTLRVSDSIRIVPQPWSHLISDSTLQALIQTSLEQNFTLREIWQKVEYNRAVHKMARGNIFPSISGNVNLSQRKFGLYTMDGAGNIATEILPNQLVPIHLPDYYSGLNTSWELDVWGKLSQQKKSAQARYFSSIEGKNLVTSSLVAEVAYLYFEFQALQDVLLKLERGIEVQEKTIEIITLQKASGQATELAVTQSQVQWLEFKSLKLETQKRINELEKALNILCGRIPQPIKKTNPLPPIPLNISWDIPSRLLENRPDIRMATWELKACHSDLASAKAALRPSFLLTANGGYQAFSGKLLFKSPQSIAYALVGGLSAPLINRSALKAQRKMADATYQQALLRYQNTWLQAYSETHYLLQNISLLQQQLVLKNQQVVTAERSMEIADQLFKNGKSNYLEVLTAQQHLLRAQLDEIQLLQSLQQSKILLYKALGGGWT